MEKREVVFLVLLFVTFATLLYFLGTSITGHVVQSMYCEKGVCKEFCRFDSDCIGREEICCQKGDFGVCELLSLCEKPYIFQPEIVDMNFESKTPYLESPTTVIKSKIIIYVVLILLATLIGIIYFSKRKKK